MTLYRGKWILLNYRKTNLTIRKFNDLKTAFNYVGLDASTIPPPEMRGSIYPSYEGQGLRIIPLIANPEEDSEIESHVIRL